MGDFTIYNVPNHHTAERLSEREEAVVADLCAVAERDANEIKPVAEVRG